MQNSEALQIKLVSVGDGAVGKTCVLMSYTENKFPEEYIPTVFETKSTLVQIDGKSIDLGLWDTAGQEQYGQLRGFAYPNTDVFLIIFSVVDAPSLENAIKKWYPELNENVPDCPKIFVGNKIDLRDDNNPQHVSKEQAKQAAGQYGCQYVECSAMNQQGLKEVFDVAVKAAVSIKYKNLDTGDKKGKKGKKDKKDKKKGGCTLI